MTVKRRLESRITPAGAGKTGFHVTMCVSKQDHPRRCGENKEINGKKYTAQGSPPQVRGKHITIADNEIARRITPAGAGKTQC